MKKQQEEEEDLGLDDEIDENDESEENEQNDANSDQIVAKKKGVYPVQM